jgi:CrcB protein
MRPYVLVMLGGAVGSLARFLTASSVMSRYVGRLPMGTVVVNVTGCFLIGLIMRVLQQRGMHDHWRLLLVVGLLGGYTTFSSFEYETFIATRQGFAWIGLLNIVLSVVLGYIAVWLGSVVAERL